MKKTITSLALLLLLVQIGVGQPANGTAEPDSGLQTSTSNCGDGVCDAIERGACPQDCDPNFEPEEEQTVNDSEDLANTDQERQDSSGENNTSGKEDGSKNFLNLRNILFSLIGLVVVFTLYTSIVPE